MSAQFTMILSCCLCLLVPKHLDSQAAQRTMYFLRDDTRHQWCGYKSQTEWKTRLNETRSDVYGGVEYRGESADKIFVTEDDSTGDWAIIDEYGLNQKAEVESLKRTINYIPENESEEQIFRIRSGQATRIRSVLRTLRTGEVAPIQHEIYEFAAKSFPTSVHGLKFFPLMNMHQAVWASGQLCLIDPQ